jgi:hypothetical protein
LLHLLIFSSHTYIATQALIRPSLGDAVNDHHYTLTAPGMPELRVPHTPLGRRLEVAKQGAEKNTNNNDTKNSDKDNDDGEDDGAARAPEELLIWDAPVVAAHCAHRIDAWFSKFLKKKVWLMRTLDDDVDSGVKDSDSGHCRPVAGKHVGSATKCPCERFITTTPVHVAHTNITIAIIMQLHTPTN